MPKTKNEQPIDIKAMLQGIKDYKLKNSSLRGTALRYNLNRNSLRRHAIKLVNTYGDISSVSDEVLLESIRMGTLRYPSNMVFNVAQERELMSYIRKYIYHYYGISGNELRELSYQLAVTLNLEIPASWKEDFKAGRNWFTLFTKRHPELAHRAPVHSYRKQVKEVCKQNIAKFFKNLSQLLDENHYDNTTIYNFIGIGFSTVLNKIGEVISLQNEKLLHEQSGKIATMALAINANGNLIPPFFLYSGSYTRTCFFENTFPGTVGLANNTGWMSQPQFFVNYLSHFIKFVRKTTDKPVLLLMDSNSTVLSIEALDMIAANKVEILTFPPLLSHILQPLDISIFELIENSYKSECTAWKKINANMVLEMQHIAGLACAALESALKQETIESAFIERGIVPFNQDIYKDMDFEKAIEEIPFEDGIDAHFSADQQRRIFLDDESNVDCKEKLLPGLLFPPKEAKSKKQQKSKKIKQKFVQTDSEDSTSSSSVTCDTSLLVPLKAAKSKKQQKPKKMNDDIVQIDSEDSCDNSLLMPLKSASTKQLRKRKKVNDNVKPKHSDVSTSPSKRINVEQSPTSEGVADSCINCLKSLPAELSVFNSINCLECKRPVHMKCANMRNSYFTCKLCSFEEENEEDEDKFLFVAV